MPIEQKPGIILRTVIALANLVPDKEYKQQCRERLMANPFDGLSRESYRITRKMPTFIYSEVINGVRVVVLKNGKILFLEEKSMEKFEQGIVVVLRAEIMPNSPTKLRKNRADFKSDTILLKKYCRRDRLPRKTQRQLNEALRNIK